MSQVDHSVELPPSFEKQYIKLEPDLNASIKSEAADVQTIMDDTVRRVREQSDRIQAAAMPYATKTRTFAEQRPVLFTFLAIFSALSFIPVSFFVGVVLSSTVFILGVAAFGICVSILTVILFSASILLPVLFFTTLMSLTALSFLLSLFLAQRLYTHVMTTTTSAADYKGMSKGVKEWLDETADRLPNVPSRMIKTEPHAAPIDKHSLNGTMHGESGMLANARMKPEFGAALGAHPFDRSPAPGIKF